jgi:methylated-DNA-protein-cysteine methyltransferase-like protein
MIHHGMACMEMRKLPWETSNLCTIMASYYEKVWEVARAVPFGKVTSYGAIARFLGTGLSARMVGYAMNKSMGVFPSVPAHRVVNRQGLLTGKMHFGHPNMMEQLLLNEGVVVQEDAIVDFEKHFWDPAVHLDEDTFFTSLNDLP